MIRLAWSVARLGSQSKPWSARLRALTRDTSRSVALMTLMPLRPMMSRTRSSSTTPVDGESTPELFCARRYAASPQVFVIEPFRITMSWQLSMPNACSPSWSPGPKTRLSMSASEAGPRTVPPPRSKVMPAHCRSRNCS